MLTRSFAVSGQTRNKNNTISENMMTKQVKAVAANTEVAAPAQVAENSTINSQNTKNIGPVLPTDHVKGPSNLFISVKTFDAEGKTVGERIVDMYHFGTRNWLQNHHWWAMHNGHCVETNVATQDEITGYLAASKEALAAKFNTRAVAA